MDFPGLLVAWYARRDERASTVRLALQQGPKDRDKRAAWLGAESSPALGAFTVRDSGELEVEVHDLQREDSRRVDRDRHSRGAPRAARPVHPVLSGLTDRNGVDRPQGLLPSGCRRPDRVGRERGGPMNPPTDEHMRQMEEYPGRVKALVIDQDRLHLVQPRLRTMVRRQALEPGFEQRLPPSV